MKKPNLILKLSTLYLVAAIFVVWGYLIGAHQVWPYQMVSKLDREISVFLFGEHTENSGLRERILLPPMEKTVDEPLVRFTKADPSFTDPGYVLLPRYESKDKTNVVELVKADTFEVLYTWTPPVQEILAKTKRYKAEDNTPDRYRAMHPYLVEDGSLVFHSAEGALVRIDKCNNIMWIVDDHFHHTVERDVEGNFISPLLIMPAQIYRTGPLAEIGYRDDGFAVITPDGTVKAVHSISKILLENNLHALLFGIDMVQRDRIHLNDAQPIYRDSGLAKKGDLAFSVRHLSMAFLYRPSTNKVIWYKIGPWLNQHDINLMSDGRYSIFNNGSMRVQGKLTNHAGTFQAQATGVMIYDPRDDSVEQPYKSILKELNVASLTEGRSKVVANGDLFIESQNQNRLLRVSPTQLRWEYVNVIGDHKVGYVNWARYLTKDDVSDFWKTAQCS